MQEKEIQEKNKITRKRTGIVVSDKMDKTVVIEETIYKTHPKYKKKYRKTKRYKVHDEGNKFKNGDKVDFIECRPVSKDKKFRVA